MDYRRRSYRLPSTYPVAHAVIDWGGGGGRNSRVMGLDGLSLNVLNE